MLRWAIASVAATVLVTSACCTTTPCLASAPPLAKTPRAFAATTDAQLATDGEQRLWLLETGYRKEQLRLALYEGGSGRWRSMKPPPQLPSDAAAVKVASAPGTLTPQPCLGFTGASTRRPIITCHGLRKWFPWSFGHLIAADAQLVDLATIRGLLVALFVSRSTGSLQVIRTNPGGGHLERTGPPLRIGSALAQLGDGTHERGDPQVEVAVESQRATPTRYVVRLEDHRWRRVGPVLRGPGLGPLVSGPVRLGQTIYMPVTDAETDPWTFSAYSSSSGSPWIQSPTGPLGGAFGNAQGRLDFAAGAIWASWQEDRQLRSGGFEAINYVARLGAEGEWLDERKLWQGRVVGPGNTQVIAFQDRLLTLYMRGRRDGRLVPRVISLGADD